MRISENVNSLKLEISKKKKKKRCVAGRLSDDEAFNQSKTKGRYILWLFPVSQCNFQRILLQIYSVYNVNQFLVVCKYISEIF